MAQKHWIARIIEKEEQAIVQEWMEALRSSESFRQQLTSDTELDRQCRDLLRRMAESSRDSGAAGFEAREWDPLRDQLAGLSDAWAEVGFSPSELAGFILLLRQPLVRRLSEKLMEDAPSLVQEVMNLNRLLDRVGLWAAEVFQHKQQEIIRRQQEELMELSTPVISIWEGIVVLPLIGTLDSTRTQQVMESLLNRIVQERARVAILDITGVPTVDTLVAQHLLKAVTAARLMGADCIISGIRPSTAQTMVQLGVDLREVTTKATLADAFAVALRKATPEAEGDPEELTP